MYMEHNSIVVKKATLREDILASKLDTGTKSFSIPHLSYMVYNDRERIPF